MLSGIGTLNLKVLLHDSDFYALQALNSYLAWDRRTRVTHLSESLEDMWDYLGHTPIAEQPDIIVMDADHLGGPEALRRTLITLRQTVEKLHIICLTQQINPTMVATAAENGASAFLLKREVGLQIAWAIVYTLSQDFTLTQRVAEASSGLFNSRVFHAAILPERREYPELTDRIRQAIKLCVIEGMPAHLAADEMGISLHTIRGYIKDGYRILESYDDSDYPVDMTPQERAFMRFTALAVDESNQD